jgi:hypothetical protein
MYAAHSDKQSGLWRKGQGFAEKNTTGIKGVSLVFPCGDYFQQTLQTKLYSTVQTLSFAEQDIIFAVGEQKSI